MNEKDTVEELIERLGSISEKIGLSSTIGIVWGTLYFKGSKTQQELKQELGVGLSAISPSITFLETVGLVSKGGKKGRKKVYSAEVKSKNNFLENFSMFQINPTIDLLKNRIGGVKDGGLKKKVNELSSAFTDLNKKIKQFMEMKK